MEKKKTFLVSAMHFFLDSYMGFFAVYLVIADLDPVKSALIITVTTFAGNILQPFMGFAADRIRGKLPLFLGLALTPICMSMIGVTTKYIPLFFLVLLGQLGSSMFHPAGANVAGAAGLDKKDKSFAIFSTVGTIGYSFSQLIFSGFTKLLSIENSFLLMLPGIGLATGYFFFSNMEIYGHEKHMPISELKQVFIDRLLPLTLLFLIMVLRSAFVYSVNFFVAKTLSEWGFGRVVYSSANTVFMLSAAGGILIAGFLAERIKPKTLLLFSLTGFFPFFLLFLFIGSGLIPTNGTGIIPAFIFLSLSGYVLHGGYGTNIVMGHRIAPEMTSTISGVLMGFAWAVSSFGPTLCTLTRGTFPGIGNIASGLLVLSFFPIAASFLALFLPPVVDEKVGLN